MNHETYVNAIKAVIAAGDEMIANAKTEEEVINAMIVKDQNIMAIVKAYDSGKC